MNQNKIHAIQNRRDKTQEVCVTLKYTSIKTTNPGLER